MRNDLLKQTQNLLHEDFLLCLVFLEPVNVYLLLSSTYLKAEISRVLKVGQGQLNDGDPLVCTEFVKANRKDRCISTTQPRDL